MRPGFYIFIIVILLFGCKVKEPETNSPYDMINLWETHHQTEWDSLSTANQLIGTWKWTYTFCCGESLNPQGQITLSENLFITFFEDATLQVTKSDVFIQESTWHIKSEDADLFGLETNPPVSQLYGRILFGENAVLFSASYRDATDNYFTKTK